MCKNMVPTLPNVLFVNHWRIWYPKLAKTMQAWRNIKWNYGNKTFTNNHVNGFITLGELNQFNPRSLYHPRQDGPLQNHSCWTCYEKQNGFLFGLAPHHFDQYDCSWSWKWCLFLVLQWVLAKWSKFYDWILVAVTLSLGGAC